MPVHELTGGEKLGLRRGDVAVCIPVYGGYDVFTQCLASVLRHTDPAVTILICDDGNVDPRFLRFVTDTIADGEWPHSVSYLRQPENGGFVRNVNSGFAAAEPADVVVLNSDCVVAEGWLSGLRAAAYSDATIATATALTNAGTIVSVPNRNHPVPGLPADATVDGVAGGIRQASGRLYPDLPTCVGHCVYLRRSALELVGPFDIAFSPGYEEEVEFSQRCVIHGLRHVLADDVFVLHRHGGSFGSSERIARMRHDHHAILTSRYPYYDDWIEEVSSDPASRLARSIQAATSSMRGISVTIDGRALTPVMTGTALVTLELAAALDAHTDVRLRVLVPPDLGSYAAGILNQRASIEILGFDALSGHIELTDVVHRPYQVSSAEDLILLRRLGRRLVITQLDSIAYRNPAYFERSGRWRDYRALTAATLAVADRVVFISQAGADDARILELVDEDRVQVIPLATEQVLAGLYPEPRVPEAAGRIADRAFLLCLGTDFLHKNRLFAIRLLEALVDAGRFDGLLVFAGPQVSTGSSAGEEAAYLAARPALASRVLDLAAVTESEKLWLLSTAAAVVYPTTYEGFGLVPYEAARVGTPCLFAWHTSLADFLPESLALLVPWNPPESAERVAPVLVEGKERDHVVAGIRMAGARLTAARNAQQHADVYARALVAPSPRAASLARELLEVQAESDRVRHALQAELGEIYDDPLNRGLAGRYAVLPHELRRPVLAVATRPALRATVTTLYRAARTARRGVGRSQKGEP